jgi:predicted metal-dependent hydrolase
VLRRQFSQSQIIIESVPIDVVRKNIKSLRLVIYPQTGRVRLSAPLWLSDDALRLYAISKLSWIKKHQKRIESREPQAARIFASGEYHEYNGGRFILEVVPHAGKPKVVLDHTALKLFVRDSSTKQQRASILAKWYRDRLKEQIPGLIKIWEQKIGVEVNAWGIKQMKTRWGSCNIRARRIWLNLELAKKPVRCLEYVVVHEIVHLLERNHSRRFAALMSGFMPQWRSLKEELNSKIKSEW